MSAKPRKPKLEGWNVFIDTIWKSGPGVLHNKSGRFFLGTNKLRAMGNFFLKAADWADAHTANTSPKRVRKVRER